MISRLSAVFSAASYSNNGTAESEEKSSSFPLPSLHRSTALASGLSGLPIHKSWHFPSSSRRTRHSQVTITRFAMFLLLLSAIAAQRQERGGAEGRTAEAVGTSAPLSSS